MAFKDYFSTQSQTYAKYRPQYPKKLFEYLAKVSPAQNCALDIAAGNGQAALSFVRYFKYVFAGDASFAQVSHAQRKNGIYYFVSKAEEIPIAENSVDLIVCAQAIHWFNWEFFYSEVSRILKTNGIIAIWGYGLPDFGGKIDKIVRNFYTNIVGEFWPLERNHIEDKYASIPFPFQKVESPVFKSICTGNLII